VRFGLVQQFDPLAVEIQVVLQFGETQYWYFDNRATDPQGGMPVDLDPIRALCDGLGITVIEDAACAAGSTYRGRPVGAGAELAAWSFHPRKILTTGEGGMLTTRNPAWADRARKLREHAMSVSANDRHA